MAKKPDSQTELLDNASPTEVLSKEDVANRSKALATREPAGALEQVPNSSSSILDVIKRAATDKTVDVDKMERLLAMYERITARDAEKAFNDAMRVVQNEMSEYKITRDSVNPSTHSKYIKLDKLLPIIQPVYTKQGFSASFGTAECPVKDHYRVTCVLSHIGGHSRPYQADLPVDELGPQGKANKSKMHAFGSSMSYGRRYMMLLIFNISLLNEDDDGNKGDRPTPPAPSAQAPTDQDAKAIATELWTVTESIVTDKVIKTWDERNAWFWKHDLLDGSDPSARCPGLTSDKYKKLLEATKKKLTEIGGA